MAPTPWRHRWVRSFREPDDDRHAGAVGARRLDAEFPDHSIAIRWTSWPTLTPRGAPQDYVVEKLKSGELKFAVEDPDAPENWPRVLTVWRANLLGFHPARAMNTSCAICSGPPMRFGRRRPAGGTTPGHHLARRCPEGKLDLLVSIDFG